MLATDNHIGYMERDPIRGQDSINTFREILQLAVKYDVSCFSNVGCKLLLKQHLGRFHFTCRRSVPREQAFTRLPLQGHSTAARVYVRRQTSPG